jgi:hypothetical protein
VKRQAGLLAAAAIGAAVLHGIAAHHLAGLDPIAAMLTRPDPGVVAAAVGVAAARLFLYLVAPAWATHLAVTSLARAIATAWARR